MPTILVVDDSAIDRRLAGRLLEKSANLKVIYANNGTEALESITKHSPDLVVTDLQMPDLDGLQLVRTISESRPDLPVVLMTAHGSENVAAQALANGASCYVPKSELAEELLSTVTQIVSMSQSDRQFEDLVRCATRTEFEFELPSDGHMIEPFIDLIQQIASSMDLFESGNRVRLGVALEHALVNAMFRGNLEIPRSPSQVIDRQLVVDRLNDPGYANRRVFVKAALDRSGVVCVIRDEGPGFDISQVPDATSPDAFRDGVGRGLVLIKAFMDEVRFNQRGNEITIVARA
jgi:CheY-like chemotaxis protein